MRHRATAEFWEEYAALPEEIRRRAAKQFALLKQNPHHASLQFKKIGDRQGQQVWSARVTLRYRALAIKQSDGYLWFWVGAHETYDVLISLKASSVEDRNRNLLRLGSVLRTCHLL